MIREPVSSSNIESIGYDPNIRVLEVEFNDKSVYQYSNVPSHEFEGIMNAGSHGQYFQRNIKNRYSYKKIN